MTSLAALADGRVVSGSKDGTLRVWDVTSGKSRALIGKTGQLDKVTSLAALADGRVVSGSEDHSLRVWGAASGEISSQAVALRHTFAAMLCHTF